MSLFPILALLASTMKVLEVIFTLANVYQAAPDLGSDNKSAYKNPKFSPSFCVKSNGDAIIRWFSSKEKLQIAMDACDCIIAGYRVIYSASTIYYRGTVGLRK